MKLTKIEPPSPMIVPLNPGITGTLRIYPKPGNQITISLSQVALDEDAPGSVLIASLPVGMRAIGMWCRDISQTNSIPVTYRLWGSSTDIRVGRYSSSSNLGWTANTPVSGHFTIDLQ